MHTRKTLAVLLVGALFVAAPTALADVVETIVDAVGSLSDPQAMATTLTVATGSAGCNGLSTTNQAATDLIASPGEAYVFQTLTSWSDCSWRSGEDPNVLFRRDHVGMYYPDTGTADYSCGPAQTSYNWDDIWFTDDSFSNAPLTLSCTMYCRNQFDVNFYYEFSTNWALDGSNAQANLFPPTPICPQ